jgi:hypothetical protein
VLSGLTDAGFLVTGAPEAAQYSLEGYLPLLPHMAWVHPQVHEWDASAMHLVDRRFLLPSPACTAREYPYIHYWLVVCVFF